VGGREITDYDLLLKVIKKSKFKITEVVSGGAKGVDSLAERYSEEVLGKKATVFAANWNDLNQAGAVVASRMNPWTKKEEKYVKNAGTLRNSDIIDYAECCIAIPGEGPGTRDSIKKAEKKGIPVYVHEPENSVEKTDDEYEYLF
jgi:hypothetical protein